MTDTIELYPRDQTDFSHHGHVLDDVSNDVVTWQLNTKFTLTFDYPMMSKYATDLVADNIVRVPVPGGATAFRIKTVVKSMGLLSITAYQVFWDLNDNFLADTNVVEKDGQAALDQIMTGANYDTGFKVMSSIGNTASARLVRMSVINALIGTDDNTFLNRWGGEFDWQDFSFSVNPRIGKDRGVRFEYAHNLLGYTATKDSTSIITRLLPEGYNGLLLPELYVDSPLIGNYRKPKVGTITYSDIKAIDETQATGDQDGAVPVDDAYKLLRDAAAKEFSDNHIDQANWTYKLNVVLLENTEEYKSLGVVSQVLPGDTVHVKHTQDDIDVEARLTAYTWQPTAKQYLTQTYDSTSRPDVAYSSLSSQVSALTNQVQIIDKVTIAKAANGLNSITWSDQSPVNLGLDGKEGDVAYQTTASGTHMWIYHDGAWHDEASDATGTQIQKQVDTKLGEMTATMTQAAADLATAKKNVADLDGKLAANEKTQADLTKQLADNTAAQATLSQTIADNTKLITTNKSDVDAALATVDSTLKQATADTAAAAKQANDAVANANSALATASSVQSGLDNLSVGGTNLLPDSLTMQSWIWEGDTSTHILLNANPEFPYSGAKMQQLSAYPWDSMSPDATTVKLVKGQSYVYSGYVRSASPGDSTIEAYYSAGNTQYNAQVIATNQFAFTESWQRVAFTFISTVDGPVTIRFESSDYTAVGGAIFIALEKLETGTVPSDWSPAPADATTYTDIQITKLQGLIDERVMVDGKIAAALSLSADGGGTVTIQGASLYVTAASHFDDASIQSAAIANLDAAKITSGSITADRLATTKLNADNITSGSIAADLIATTALSATNIISGTLDVGKLTVKNLSADMIASGTIDASKITVKNLSASNIIGGELDAGLVNVKNINASNIITGTLNAGLLNVIGLNASAISAGTITGANLAINLNTGTVTFQSGRIHSTTDNIDINVDKGYMSVADSTNRVLLKGGQIQFIQPTLFDTQTSPYLSISNKGVGSNWAGATIIGRDSIMLANSANVGSDIFTWELGKNTFSGLISGKNANGTWEPTILGGAERGVVIVGGSPDDGTVSSSPFIRVGASMDGQSAWSCIYMRASYIIAPAIYSKTTGGSSNVVVINDGSLRRSTSASKYKTMIERSRSTSMAEALISLPTAHWLDKAELSHYASGEQKQAPTPYFGMIAEDLAAAGLEDLVVRGDDGELEGINYDRIAPALLPLLAQMKQEIEELKSAAKSA
ncbi:phage tail spike protein [Lacticaseibacillus sp. GG6-2]